MVLLLFALPSIDAWTVNVNARLSARELDAIAAHARPRRVIYLTGASPAARNHAERRGAGRFDLEGWGEALISAADEATAAEPIDADPPARVAALLYTTGTTGEPKGVMLTHRGFMHIARLATELRGLVPGDRVYGLLPFTHVYGMASVVYGSLCSGASLDLQARFRRQGNVDADAVTSIALLNKLASASVELERMLGINFNPAYPAEQPLMPGNIERQAACAQCRRSCDEPGRRHRDRLRREQ